MRAPPNAISGACAAAFLLVSACSSRPAPKGDAQRGQAVFQACVPCHRGMPGAIGPDLSGVVGRAPGSLSDFRYSSAMRRAGGAWTPDRLRAFVKEPQVVVPGTRMPFSGLPATRDEEDVVAYLASLR